MKRLIILVLLLLPISLFADTRINGPWTASTALVATGSTVTVDVGTSGHKLPYLDGANAWSAVQTFGNNDLKLNSSVGTITLNAPAVAGNGVITFPQGTTNFSATGGASQVIKQTTLGGALTVGQINYTDLAGSLACAGLSDDGTACTANTGTSGTVLPFLDGANTWSGQNLHNALETFTSVWGAIDAQSGTTYTFVADDCGKTVIFTSSSAVTATIPASIVPASASCSIAVLQAGTAKVSVNGSAVTPATLISENGFTGTSGTAGNMIGLFLATVSAQTRAYLTGSGS